VVPGADWGESIINAIESSRIMVLIFSQSVNASPQIKREVERAVNKGVYDFWATLYQHLLRAISNRLWNAAILSLARSPALRIVSRAGTLAWRLIAPGN